MHRFSALLVLVSMLIGPVAMPLRAQESPRPVKLMAVDAHEPMVMRQFFGHVVARQTVDLAFQVAGQVVELPVTEGQLLTQGEMIAQLDMETFDSQLQRTRLQQNKADRAIERLQRLTGNFAREVSLAQAETQIARFGAARR